MFEKFIPYHVLSRAVDNKPIFSDQEDCARFLFQIYANNVGRPGLNLYRKNMKDKREGILFNKPYKIIPLKSDDQLDTVIRYINVKNPLDFYNSDWHKGLDNWQEAFNFLDNYKFSSYPDLFGERSSKILAPEAILNKYLGEKSRRNKIENLDFIEDYLGQKLADYKALFLE